MTESIFAYKKKYNNVVKKSYFVNSNYKTNSLVCLKNIDNIDFLIDGFKVLPSNFLFITDKDIEKTDNISCTKKIQDDILEGFDFIICDNDIDSLKKYFKAGIVPILPENNYLSSILSEFDPIKNTGNCYLYKENNMWSLYYSLIRYLENYKFPYDNRNLVKNVISI